MTPAAPAYRRLSVEERRSQLLEAALSLFAHRVPEDVSLDDVAEAAGVSRPLVYRYFPGASSSSTRPPCAPPPRSCTTASTSPTTVRCSPAWPAPSTAT